MYINPYKYIHGFISKSMHRSVSVQLFGLFKTFLHSDITDFCISQDAGLLTGAISKLYSVPDDIQLVTCAGLPVSKYFVWPNQLK